MCACMCVSEHVCVCVCVCVVQHLSVKVLTPPSVSEQFPSAGSSGKGSVQELPVADLMGDIGSESRKTKSPCTGLLLLNSQRKGSA